MKESVLSPLSAHTIFKDGASHTERGHSYNSYGSPLPKSEVREIFANEFKNIGDGQKNKGDDVAHPLNNLNPHLL
jgi:hypothetical protein